MTVESLALCAIMRSPAIYDDVIKWKHFPRNWPLVWWIHRSPVNFPHKGQWRGALMSSLIYAWIKVVSEQSWGWWFETPSHLFWRHCNEINGFLSSVISDVRGHTVKFWYIQISCVVEFCNNNHNQYMLYLLIKTIWLYATILRIGNLTKRSELALFWCVVVWLRYPYRSLETSHATLHFLCVWWSWVGRDREWVFRSWRPSMGLLPDT